LKGEKTYDMNYKIYRVAGNSMSFTLEDGDYVLVASNKEVQDTDVVVCNTEHIYTANPYIIKRYSATQSTYGLYLLGDNEHVSYDSRNFGELPKSSCEGVAIIRFSLKRGLSFL
jgi:signal peptidase I